MDQYSNILRSRVHYYILPIKSLHTKGQAYIHSDAITEGPLRYYAETVEVFPRWYYYSKGPECTI